MRRLAVALGLTMAVAGVGLAHAGKRTRRMANVPRGWAWPPSPKMKSAGKSCLADLDAAKVEYKRAKSTRKVNTAIVVPSMTIGGIELRSKFRKPPFVMDCHLVRALHRHSSVLRELGIVALRFSTIHEYRTIRKNGRPTNILSRHALGLAMDIYDVVLDDGTKVNVKRDYPKGHRALLELERVINAADEFRTPLTPGNDRRGHDDHFHFEAHMYLGG